jgi:ribosome-binding protein aMBF1 (putative translation factor)
MPRAWTLAEDKRLLKAGATPRPDDLSYWRHWRNVVKVAELERTPAAAAGRYNALIAKTTAELGYGALIATARKRLGKTQNDLARVLGSAWSQASVSDLERGRERPRDDEGFHLQLARELEIPDRAILAAALEERGWVRAAELIRG